jgi:hypothetical protein
MPVRPAQGLDRRLAVRRGSRCDRGKVRPGLTGSRRRGNNPRSLLDDDDMLVGAPRSSALSPRPTVTQRSAMSDKTLSICVIAALLSGLLLAGVACGGGSDGEGEGTGVSSGLTGKWQTTPEFEDVTMTLRDDKTFAWDNRTQGSSTNGTLSADARTLTFSFAEEQLFCPRQTITWEYQLEGDTLTSDVVANTCGLPPGGSWEFKRQT